jgi:hypothetical protein
MEEGEVGTGNRLLYLLRDIDFLLRHWKKFQVASLEIRKREIYLTQLNFQFRPAGL